MSLRATASLSFHLSRYLLVLLLLLSSGISLAKEPDAGQKLQKTTANDDYKAFTINTIFNLYSNNGDGSYNKYTSKAGLEFPKGSLKTAIFEDGVVWGGFHKGRAVPKVGGSVYRHGLQAGRIITAGGPTEAEPPVADDPLKPAYRVFCVRSDVRPTTPFETVQGLLSDEAALISRFATTTAQSLYDQYVNDWNEWPAKTAADPTGLAPFTDRNGDGLYDPAVDIPGEPGADQTLYYVANDMNSTRTQFLAGCPPIGLEMHRSIWGYNKAGALGQTIFSSTLLINKSGAPVDSMFLVQWSDPDLGDSGDDFVGCDTSRNLGFVYNGKPNDATYGVAVPAAGYRLLQGPRVPSNLSDSALFRQQYRHGFKNLGMTTFVFFTQGFPQYSDPVQGIDGDRQWYRLMNGLTAAVGAPFVDPTTGNTTKFTVYGDPVTGQGWLDGMAGVTPNDRRMCMVSGPFTFAANDTQEIVVATLIAQGADRFSSIVDLKYAADLIVPTYPTGHNHLPPLTQVSVSYPQADSAALLITVNVRGTGVEPVSGLLKNADSTVIPNIIFTDSGTAPDTAAGDGIYSARVTVPRLPKALTLDLNVSDSTGSFTWPDIVQGITVTGLLSVSGPVIFSDNLNSNGEANSGENIRYGLSILNTTPFPLSGLSVFQEGTLQKRVPWPDIAPGASAGISYDPANPASYFSADMPGDAGLSSYTVRYRITDANGNLWRDSVLFEVIPLADSVRSNNTLHVGGIADGNFAISVVDQGALRHDLYVIHIVDSVNAAGEPGITLKDSTDGRILLSNHVFPDSLGHNMPVIDGFKVVRGTVDIQHKGYKEYSVPSGFRHWSWIDGNWGAEGFGGAIGNAYDNWFSGSTVGYDGLKSVEIRYANADGIWDPKTYQGAQANFSRGYRYVRLASSSPAKPEFSPWIVNPSAGFAYQDYNWGIPFSAWNMDAMPPIRLMVGHLENNTSGGLVDGRHWPPLYGTGIDNTVASGPREFFFIFDVPYSETPDPALQVDILNHTVPMMWMGTVTRRSMAPNYADTSTFRIVTYHPPTSRDMWIFRSDTLSVMGLGVLGELPSVFALEQNFPNPFNPSTTIRYALPHRSHVTLTVFNMLGQRVAELVNGEMEAGYHSVAYNANNLASGMYFYRLQAGSFAESKKLILLK